MALRRKMQKRLESFRKFKRAASKDARFNHALNQDDLSKSFSLFYKRGKASASPDSANLPRSRGELRESIKARKQRDSLIKEMLTDVDYTIVDFNIMVGNLDSHEQPLKAEYQPKVPEFLPEDLKRKLRESVKNRQVHPPQKVCNFPALQSLLMQCWRNLENRRG